MYVYSTLEFQFSYQPNPFSLKSIFLNMALPKACCTIPPVVSDYVAKGTFEEIGDLKIYWTGPKVVRMTNQRTLYYAVVPRIQFILIDNPSCSLDTKRTPSVA